MAVPRGPICDTSLYLCEPFSTSPFESLCCSYPIIASSSRDLIHLPQTRSQIALSTAPWVLQNLIFFSLKVSMASELHTLPYLFSCCIYNSASLSLWHCSERRENSIQRYKIEILVPRMFWGRWKTGVSVCSQALGKCTGEGLDRLTLIFIIRLRSEQWKKLSVLI